MKYLGKRPSRADKDVDVFEFAAGRSEMEILHSLVSRAYHFTPDTIENLQTRGRLRNMVKVLGDVMADSKPRKWARADKIRVQEAIKEALKPYTRI